MGNRFVMQACLGFALILGCASTHANINPETSREEVYNVDPTSNEQQDQSPSVSADGGTTLYNLADAHQKLVDNRGNGYDELYGTRNVRAVLRGVYYRGGANNYFDRTHPRANSNPLPDEGLMHLCQQGFTESVYLYTTNYAKAPHTVKCKKDDGSANQLDYMQISVLSASRDQLKTLIGMIYDHAKNPNKMGLIYDHCWNGWHASGITAAYTLMQMCDFSHEQAVAYWNMNTDGNDGKSYDSIRKKIRAFTRFDGMDLTSAEKAAYCPNPDTYKFQ